MIIQNNKMKGEVIMSTQKTNTRFVVEAGVMIAIATILSYITIVQMPQGGTVTAGSMIPILIIGLRYGLKKGILTGIVYGILQAILQGYVIHPVQFLLDYPLAFGALGLSGLFSGMINKADLKTSKKYPYIIFGVIVALAGRFVCHVLAGAIFFKEYAGAQNPWIYSIVYNSTYLAAELIISVIVLLMLWTVLERAIFRKVS